MVTPSFVLTEDAIPLTPPIPTHLPAGDNMSLVVGHWAGIDLVADPWVKRIVLTALSTGAVLPLALLKNMAALSKTSFVSLLSVIFILGVVILNAAAGTAAGTIMPTKPEDTELRFIDVKFGPAVSLAARRGGEAPAWLRLPRVAGGCAARPPCAL